LQLPLQISPLQLPLQFPPPPPQIMLQFPPLQLPPLQFPPPQLLAIGQAQGYPGGAAGGWPYYGYRGW
jgi:hypothetical protein